jgi:hypothetical protein
LPDFGYYAERFLGNKVITAEYSGGNQLILGSYAEPFGITILLACFVPWLGGFQEIVSEANEFWKSLYISHSFCCNLSE